MVYSRTDLLGIWMFLLPAYGLWDREAAMRHALVPKAGADAGTSTHHLRDF
jgi:hypothetical protein